MIAIRQTRRLGAVVSFALLAACSTGQIEEAEGPAVGVADRTDDAGAIASSRQALEAGSLCAACRSNRDCGGAGDLCLRNGRTGESFCGQACADTDCPSGFFCYQGRGFAQCVPEAMTCVGFEPDEPGEEEPGEEEPGEEEPGEEEPGEEEPGEEEPGEEEPGEEEPGEEEPPTDECASMIEAEELALTNQARADAGLGPLVCDAKLATAARLHSQDMCDRDYFSHTTPEGLSFIDRIEAQGATWRTGGENIAWGYRTAASVHTGWMNSDGHRRNILNGAFGRVGIGYVECGGSPYWTQVFTN